jgi:phosphocarrier protein HPr
MKQSPAPGSVPGSFSLRLKITNKLGLHARAAAKLVQTLNRFDIEVELECGGDAVNARSILGILTLAVSKGADITLTATGIDAEAALDAAQKLIEDKFGEGE